MSQGLTDNKASVPQWTRSLIVFFHGCDVMDLIDITGSLHDSNLKDGIGRKQANRLMISEMAGLVSIPAYITLGFWFMLWVYRMLPDYISRLYWRVV